MTPLPIDSDGPTAHTTTVSPEGVVVVHDATGAPVFSLGLCEGDDGNPHVLFWRGAQPANGDGEIKLIVYPYGPVDGPDAGFRAVSGYVCSNGGALFTEAAPGHLLFRHPNAPKP